MAMGLLRPEAQFAGAKNIRMGGDDLFRERRPGTRHPDNEQGTTGSAAPSLPLHCFRSMGGNDHIDKSPKTVAIKRAGKVPLQLVGAFIVLEGLFISARIVAIFKIGRAH